jgi:hypothetical protein
LLLSETEMIRYLIVGIALVGVLLPASAQKVALITATEAELPPASGTLATRGISRGPGVKLLSPDSGAPVKGPVNLKMSFEGRGGEKVDPASVRVTYMKTPMVDLTSRMQTAISANGIDLSQADIPPGEHTLRVTVKDTAGRETNSTMTLIVAK